MRRLLLISILVFFIIVSSGYATTVMYISEAPCYIKDCDCYNSTGYFQDYEFCQKLESFNYVVYTVDEAKIIANNPDIVDSIYDAADIIFLGNTSTSAYSLTNFCNPIANKLVDDEKFLFSTLSNNHKAGCIFDLGFVTFDGTDNYFSGESDFKKISSGTDDITGTLNVDSLTYTIKDELYQYDSEIKVRAIDENNGGFVGIVTDSDVYPVLQTGLGGNKAVFWGFENPTNYTSTTWKLFENTFKAVLGEFETYDLNGTLLTDKTSYQPGDKINITFVEGEIEPDRVIIKIFKPDNSEYYSADSDENSDEKKVKDQGNYWNLTSAYKFGLGEEGGIYTINITASKGASEITYSKTINIIPYTIDIYTDETTYSAGENVNLNIDIKNSYLPKPNITANVSVVKPTSTELEYFYNKIAHNTYDISYPTTLDAVGGNYKFIIKLNDSSSRKYSFEQDFTVKTSGDITVTPSEWNIATTTAGEHERTFSVKNNGNTTLSNLQITAGSTINIIFDETNIETIEANNIANFTATADLQNEGNYTNQIILSSDSIDYRIDVTADFSEAPVENSLSVSPSSFSVVTIANQKEEKEFDIQNIADTTATLTYEIDDSISDIISIKEKPATIAGDGTETMKIEIDTSELDEDTYTGTIEMSSNIGDDSITITVDVIGDISEDSDIKITELNSLKERLDKLKSKDGYDTLLADYNDIKATLEDAKTSYENNEYESAKSNYQSALSDISRLESSIENLELQESDYSGIIWAVAIIIIIAIIGILAWKYKDNIEEIINKMLGKEEKQEPQQDYYPYNEEEYRTDYY